MIRINLLDHREGDYNNEEAVPISILCFVNRKFFRL